MDTCVHCVLNGAQDDACNICCEECVPSTTTTCEYDTTRSIACNNVLYTMHYNAAAAPLHRELRASLHINTASSMQIFTNMHAQLIALPASLAPVPMIHINACMTSTPHSIIIRNTICTLLGDISYDNMQSFALRYDYDAVDDYWVVLPGCGSFAPHTSICTTSYCWHESACHQPSPTPPTHMINDS